MKGLAVLLVVAGTAVFLLAGHSADKGEASASEIAHYQKWKLVNPKLYYVPDPTAALCAASTAIRNPHSGKYVRVYVNRVGQLALLSRKAPTFPVGSVVVKEKLAQRDSKQPELMTVMIKRNAGFNPEHGDWEFMVVNGADEAVQERGKLHNCQSCHDGVKDADFTFRTYLPRPPHKGKST